MITSAGVGYQAESLTEEGEANSALMGGGLVKDSGAEGLG